MPTIDQLTTAAPPLAPDEAADLIHRQLRWERFAAESDAAWQAEIARRIAELDSGSVEAIPFDQLMAVLRIKHAADTGNAG